MKKTDTGDRPTRNIRKNWPGLPSYSGGTRSKSASNHLCEHYLREPVTEANIAGPGQSDPRTRREMVPESPRTDIDSNDSTPPKTYVLGFIETPTPSASPECCERWPGDDGPERLAPLPVDEPDHVCDPRDPMCVFPQRKDPEEIITDPRQVGLHVCRPRDPWCQNDHQGPKTDRKMTSRMNTTKCSILLVRALQQTPKHYMPKGMDGPVYGPAETNGVRVRITPQDKSTKPRVCGTNGISGTAPKNFGRPHDRGPSNID